MSRQSTPNNSAGSRGNLRQRGTIVVPPSSPRLNQTFEAVDQGRRELQSGALESLYRFRTLRGDVISFVEGRRPANTSEGLPYPTFQQVGVGVDRA